MNAIALTNWKPLPHGAAVRFGRRGQSIFAELVCRLDGAEAVRLTIMVNMRVIQAKVARALSRLLASREAAGDDVDYVGRLRVANRTERMRARKARKEKRKRVASRWRKAFARVVKQIARLKLVDKLRKVMRGIFGSKLSSSALKLAGPAIGMAFGGPAGAAIGSQLGGALAAFQLGESGQGPKVTSTQDLYRLGCACG